jgi:hypothetical protein
MCFYQGRHPFKSVDGRISVKDVLRGKYEKIDELIWGHELTNLVSQMLEVV